MSKLKVCIIVITVFTLSIGFAQNYPFIPQNQRVLSNKELKTVEIVITPDVMLFSERGELLPASQMELLSNPDFTPLFYVDSSNKVKSVIFQKKNKQPIYIQENPEAYFENGEHALDFLTTDLKGNHIKLSDLKGKVVVLNFWFTQCNPCVEEIPNLNTLVEQYRDKDVVFLAISFNKSKTIKTFLKSNPFNYTIAPDAMDTVSIYGVQSYPTNMVINKKGEIVLKEIGYRTNISSLLSEAIDTALN